MAKLKSGKFTTSLIFDQELWHKLTRFQQEHKITSRSRAVRMLLAAALGDPVLQQAVVEGEFYFRSVMLKIFRRYSADFLDRLPEMLTDIENEDFDEVLSNVNNYDPEAIHDEGEDDESE